MATLIIVISADCVLHQPHDKVLINFSQCLTEFERSNRVCGGVNCPNSRRIMELLFSDLAESYFEDHLKQELGEEAVYVNFVLSKGTRSVHLGELRYLLGVGRLLYRESAGSILEARNLLVKYFETSVSEPGVLPGFPGFSLELHFFQTLLPILDQMKATEHLFAKFCVCRSSSTPTSNRYAVVFEWPRHTPSFERIPSKVAFGFTRCSLMLKKIAHFHARSLLLKKTQPDRFEEMNFASTWSVLLNSQLVQPTLVRCLQPLLQDRRMDPQYHPHFQTGVLHLFEILQNFDHHLVVPFSRSSTNDECWVLCHMNYGQHSVIFEYSSILAPYDAKIFNCQSVGFASLSVDLVLPLFVELGEFNRGRNVEKLLKQYYAELQQADSDLVVPSLATIITEIKKAVPFALCVLARRISRAQSDFQPEHSLFSPNLWKENLITELYKYLISNHYV